MIRTASMLVLTLALPLSLAILSSDARAQTPADHVGDPTASASTGRWSPFALPGDLPRGMPTAPVLIPGLVPAPRVGLFWTGGNPGALPLEVATSRADFQLGHTSAAGDYRRPLDPRERATTGLSMSGWGPVEDRAAMVGRVRFDRLLHASAPSAHALAPYGSSPFAVVDTTTTDMTYTRALLEGAAGWRLGAFGLGLATGYSASEGRTSATAVPRRSLVAAPAASFGLTRDFADGRVRAGAVARWTQRVESIRINAIGSGTHVYLLDGYRPPEILPLPAPNTFYRRIERNGRAAGGGLSVMFGPWRWAAHAEIARIAERQWSRRENDPPRDIWDADALSAAMAVQRPFGDEMFFTIHGRWTGVSGTAAVAAAQPESGGVSLRADESAVTASAELRRMIGASGWGGRLLVSAGYTDRERVDPRADLSLLLETLVTGLAIHVDRRIGRRLSVSGGAALVRHQGRGAIPHPNSLGPVIEDILYGEVALQSATAIPWALSGSATFAWRPGVRLWAEGRYTSGSTTEVHSAPLPPMQDSDRSGWGLTLGATLVACDDI